MLGQLSAERRIGGKSHVFHKMPSLRRYGTLCDEKMKDVCYCVHLLFLSLLLRVCWVLFLQGVERGTSVRMHEAYAAAALVMCGGEPLCWWIRTRLGGLQRDG
jgi:hypothetical protein